MRGKIGARLIGAQRGEFMIWDDEVKGFYARRQSMAGKITFGFRYTDPAGKKREIKIGVAGPDCTPDKARARAIVEAGKTRGGVDPAALRDAQRAMPTLTEVWADYETHVLSKKRGRTPEAYRANWETHIKPALGAKRVNEITGADVERLHKAVTELGAIIRPPDDLSKDERKRWRRRGGPVAANRVIDTLSAIFTRAQSPQRRWVDFNPCKGIEANGETPRDVRFSRAEIALIQRALLDEADDIQIAFGLFLETPLRHQNVAAAEAEEFVDRLGPNPIWRIPGHKMKGGHPYEAPLSIDLAQKIDAYIARNRAISSRYLFPLVDWRLGGRAPKKGAPIEDDGAGPTKAGRKVYADRPRAKFQSAWERIKARALALAGAQASECAGLKAGTIHTFKHTYLSEMADLGATAMEVQKIGDHADIRTSMIYVGKARARVRDLARQRHEQLAASRAAQTP